MHNPAPVLENDTHKLVWDFDIRTDHLISTRRTDLIIINNKKRICKIVDFAVPANHRIKLKECEKKDKYLDLARELKKIWNMKVTIITIVIGAFGAVTKGLLKGLNGLEVGGRVETIQTTALLRTARILKRVLETWGDLLSSNSSERLSANTDVKNSQGVNNNVSSSFLWYTNNNLSNHTYQRHKHRKWTREDNKLVLHCYFRTNPTKRGYRKRWEECARFQII